MDHPFHSVPPGGYVTHLLNQALVRAFLLFPVAGCHTPCASWLCSCRVCSEERSHWAEGYCFLSLVSSCGSIFLPTVWGVFFMVSEALTLFTQRWKGRKEGGWRVLGRVEESYDLASWYHQQTDFCYKYCKSWWHSAGFLQWWCHLVVSVYITLSHSKTFTLNATEMVMLMQEIKDLALGLLTGLWRVAA